MTRLTLGYSPCPNDTFIFYGLVHGLIETGDLSFSERLLDVEALNHSAVNGLLDVTKVSFHAYMRLMNDYELLKSGGAMGRGCGPLVVAREPLCLDDLIGSTIAIPGELTTAYLLLSLYNPAFRENVKVMRFDRIMSAVANGEVDAGLIIHESRFTYPSFGLLQIADLGAWWEAVTGLPIPLGCIVAKKTLGTELIKEIDALVKKSVLYAINNPYEPTSYIKRHSLEMDEDVIKKHIGLYVNEFSVDLGDEGMRAVDELVERAKSAGIV